MKNIFRKSTLLLILGIMISMVGCSTAPTTAPTVSTEVSSPAITATTAPTVSTEVSSPAITATTAPTVSTEVSSPATTATTAPTVSTEGCPAKKDNITIGVLLATSTNQTAVYMMDAMIDQAAKMCVKIIPLYYEHSVPILISDIEDFITMGAQGIITQHESQQAGLDALKEAKAAGLVVVNYDTVMPEGVYDYAFTASNHDVGYAIGKMAAEWAKTNLVAKGQQVTIGIVDYPTVPFLVERENGITDALAQLLPEGKIVIRGAAVNLVNGVNVGENFLSAYPNMNLVAGINDGSMQGVYEAFQAGGLGKKDIGLFSCDGTTESVQYISQNTIYRGTIDLGLNGIGREMVEFAVDKIRQEAVAQTRAKINYYPINPITVDNAASLLK